MATRHELDRELTAIQNELYAIISKHALDIPNCAVEEIAVYFAIKKIPDLYDW